MSNLSMSRQSAQRVCCGAVLVAVLVGCEGQAHAYIDPGTGSYLFQLLIASFLGALFVLKMYWKNLITKLRRRPARDREEDDA